MTRVQTVFELDYWLENSWDAEACIYHEGFIANDRVKMLPEKLELVNYARLLGTPKDCEIYRIEHPRNWRRSAGAARSFTPEPKGARGKGRGFLLQERLGVDRFRYIFQKAAG